MFFDNTSYFYYFLLELIHTFLAGKCIAVPNSDEILEIFGFAYAGSYNGSAPGSPKDSSDQDIKPIVQVVVNGKYFIKNIIILSVS